MLIEWEGVYLDGKSAARHPATVRLMKSGLEITPHGGQSLWWPYAEIRQTQGTYAGEQVRLERGRGIPEVLLIHDLAFLTTLHQVTASGLGGRFHNPRFRRLRTKLTFVAALAVVALTVIIYRWGLPAMAMLVAPRVPVAWEERLGASIADQIAPPAQRCTDPVLLRAVDEIVQVLRSTRSPSPYVFRVTVLDQPVVNALAAPGGSIVIFRGLLRKTDSAEELAGVLAHELQHVLQRHSTRAILQQASSGILIAALTGDVSGVGTLGLEAAHLLGALRYSRQNEEEADREGMKMVIAAGVDPAGMIRMYEVLTKEAADVPGVLAYLSTHPNTQNRINDLKALVANTQPQIANPLLPHVNWTELRERCG